RSSAVRFSKKAGLTKSRGSESPCTTSEAWDEDKLCKAVDPGARMVTSRALGDPIPDKHLASGNMIVWSTASYCTRVARPDRCGCATLNLNLRAAARGSLTRPWITRKRKRPLTRIHLRGGVAQKSYFYCSGVLRLARHQLELVGH